MAPAPYRIHRIPIIILIIITILSPPSTQILNNQPFMSSPELAKAYGYTLEIHTVTTTDGYILTLFHLPAPSPPSPYPPLFIMHGLAGSSDDFLSNQGKSPAFYFVDRGYDVWLGNNRGNVYSTGHVDMDRGVHREYWNFSYEEFGMIDCKGFIDYITHTTQIDKLLFLGHTEGNGQIFLGTALDPVYFRDKLHGIAAWGPVTNLHGLISPILRIATFLHLPQFLLDLNFHVFWVRSKLFLINYLVVMGSYISHSIAKIGLKLLSDSETPNMNMESFVIWIGHYPSTTSMKAMAQWCQWVNHGFSRYATTREIYSGELFQYNLKVVEGIPIAILYGKYDELAIPQGALWLKGELEEKNDIRLYKEYGLGCAAWLAPTITEHLDDTHQFFTQIINT